MEQRPKIYKYEIIITSIITLCPILLGIIFWNQLPDTIETHFDLHNTANGWSSKGFAVFGIPLFLFVVHLLCVGFIRVDPKYKAISRKVVLLLLWIVPIASIITNGTILLNALGKTIDIRLIVNLLCGILFLLIGNYLPKCRQNYTIGIKTPWALEDEENWNKTNRFGGWCFLIAGIGFVINSFLLQLGLFIIFVCVCVLLPVGYSFVLYKKKN